jgi:hypothetical protein
MSSDLRPTPNLEGQVSVFMSPSDKLAQLQDQAPGSLFIAGLLWSYSNPPPQGNPLRNSIPTSPLRRRMAKISGETLRWWWCILNCFSLHNNCWHSQGLIPGRGKVFIFSTEYRPVLKSTQSPTQWAPAAKRPGLEADSSHPPSAWNYISMSTFRGT